MTNFIFKSPSDLQKISQQLVQVLAEQRHQRSDLALLISQMVKVTNQFNLEEQVKGYYSQEYKQEKLQDGSD